MGHPTRDQRLINVRGEVELEEHRTLSYYNIQKDTAEDVLLEMRIAGRGGAGKRPRVIVDATPKNSDPEPIKAIFAYADTFQCPKACFKGLRPEEKESYNEFLQKTKNNERMVEGTVQRFAPVVELKANMEAISTRMEAAIMYLQMKAEEKFTNYEAGEWRGYVRVESMGAVTGKGASMEE